MWSLGRLAVVAAMGLTLAAVAQAGSHATKITVYSGQHPETVAALVSAFEKQTGINVAVRSDDEGVLAAQIVQEGKHSPADIFIPRTRRRSRTRSSEGCSRGWPPRRSRRRPAKYSSPQQATGSASRRA